MTVTTREPSHGTWTRPRPTREGLRFDVILAVALALAATTTALLYDRVGIYAETAPIWVWIVGLGLSTLPLAARRIWPVPVAILVSIGFFVCGQFAVPELLIVNISLFIGLYAVGAWEPRRALAIWSRIAISLAMVVWLLVSLIIASSNTEAMPEVSRSGIFSAFATYAVIQIITNLIYFSGAFMFGNRSWQAARAQAQLEAQGHELALERRTSAEQAVALDRIEIARELHDVVAHHVSVMGIQAAAARRLLEKDAESGRERAQQALLVVETSAETAIAELRGLVGTLRAPEPSATASTIGIAQLPALVAASQGAGVPATLIIAGTPHPLPMLIDVALYRVAQEALTNVRKHAGRGAEATVRLRFETGAVELEVSDTGIAQRLAAGAAAGAGGSAASSGSGLGLRGMRERAGAVGGTVEVGRRETGGFLVRVRVPLREPSPAPGSAAGPASTTVLAPAPTPIPASASVTIPAEDLA
ncbi:signal transduction histidine kinase [Leucobacter exalbidus]|uniref:histidine kinase n=1 Tax=Leucobacter exalbidus TaxID=662960 RepID=A0A940PM27_9MICO|nr:histidine kinase [Leucobacter exalbidus]MBP1326422.1 signal transduction histidine kinase [Leucobacter exalbidus]